MTAAKYPWFSTIATTVALVSAVTVLARLLEAHLGIANLALLYLLPVMVQSGRAGLRAGLFTSLMAALAFNFFLVPPRFTLHVADPDNVVTLLVLFAVAVAVSEMASRLRQQAARAERLASASAELARFSETIAGAGDAGEALGILEAVLHTRLGLKSRWVDMGLVAPDAAFSGLDAAAARWAAENGSHAGRGTAVMAGAEWMFAPLAAAGSPLGVLAVVREDAALPVSRDDEGLFGGLLDRARQCLVRIDLATQARARERDRQRDQLRDALLSSLSHDLRTPLTAIRGGLSALSVAPDDRIVLQDVRTAAARLERTITNLLEITRIEARALPVVREVIDLTDSIAEALAVLPPPIGKAIRVDLPPALPLVRSNAHMLHHMLLNLIENAIRHGNGPEGVVLEITRDKQELHLLVADHGPGIDMAAADTLFDRFHRMDMSDARGGSGLGLAIVRGFGAALGLETSVANRTDGTGAVFTIGFPAATLVSAS